MYLALAELHLFQLPGLLILGESCFKAPKALLEEIFYHCLFIFANFVQKVNFELSQFQKMGVAAAEFHLVQLPVLPVLRESCFKAPQVLLDKSFYHLNVQFC